MALSGGYASDRTPFFGLKVPLEVKKLAQLAKSADQGTLRAVLKGWAVKYSLAQPDSRLQMSGLTVV